MAEAELLQTLLPEDDSNDYLCTDYLSRLCQNVNHLSREGVSIAEACKTNLEMRQGLAADHYSTFISAANGAQQVTCELKVVDELLSDVSSVALETSKISITEKLSELLNLKRKIGGAISQQGLLLDLLELPQLMETCARYELVDEALQVSAMILRLAARHPDLPLVHGLALEADAVQEVLKQQLLTQLHSSVSLPVQLRVVSGLKRLKVAHVPIVWLSARNECLQTRLASAIEDKFIEETRVGLLEIATHYRALFGGVDNKLSSWLIHRIEIFLARLTKILDCAASDPQKLLSLTSQATYLAVALSKIGVDFRPQILSILTNAISEATKHALERVLSDFVKLFESYSYIPSANILAQTIVSPIDPQTGDICPPTYLASHPPLVWIANEICVIFNGLVSCCPLSAVITIKSHLMCFLIEISKFLVSRWHTTNLSLSDDEKSHFTDLSSVFVYKLVPFVNNCFAHLFSSKHLHKSAVQLDFSQLFKDLHDAFPSIKKE